MQTNAVFQAVQADRCLGNTSFKIPVASYTIFQMLSLTIRISIYDRIIVPYLSKITKKEDGITILQRMGVGMVIAVATMVVSALVENWRRTVALAKPTIGVVARKGNISSLSASWLIPQMALAGLAEAFTGIAKVEFFYKQFPENMRSFGGSFLFCGFAMSTYLSSLIISIVHKGTRNASGIDWVAEDLNKGRLDYLNYLVTALEVFNLGCFLICAKWYKYKGTQGKSDDDVAMEDLSSRAHMV